MGKGYHIIRTLRLCRIDSILHEIIQRSWIEGIDIFSTLVFKLGGRRRGDRVRCRDADISNVYIAIGHDGIGFKIRFRFTDLLEIAADRFRVHHADQLRKPLHTVVKLMIAQRYRIISNKIHQIDDILALRDGSKAASLDIVAAGNYTHVGIGILQFLFHRGKP